MDTQKVIEIKRMCPKCGSENVEPKSASLTQRQKSPNIWECNDCGYTGLMPEKQD